MVDLKTVVGTRNLFSLEVCLLVRHSFLVIKLYCSRLLPKVVHFLLLLGLSSEG